VVLLLNTSILFLTLNSEFSISPPTDITISQDSLKYSERLTNCPNCDYKLMVIGEIQKCTLCGYSSRISDT
jgi:hypothetical protein